MSHVSILYFFLFLTFFLCTYSLDPFQMLFLWEFFLYL